VFNRVRYLLHQLLNIAWSYWKLKFIWNTSVYILFEKREQGEVEPGSFGIETSFDFLIFGDRSIVDEGVVVKEESAGDIESYEYIYAVMFVSGQDKEDSKAIAEPSECVEEEDSSTRVFSDEEVEESERDRVTREHIVSARSHPLQRKSSSRPNDKGFVQSASPTSIRAWLAIKVNPRDGETSYQHGETSQQEDGASDSETSSGNDKSVTVEYHHDQPYCQQSHS